MYMLQKQAWHILSFAHLKINQFCEQSQDVELYLNIYYIMIGGACQA